MGLLIVGARATRIVRLPPRVSAGWLAGRNAVARWFPATGCRLSARVEACERWRADVIDSGLPRFDSYDLFQSGHRLDVAVLASGNGRREAGRPPARADFWKHGAARALRQFGV